MRAILTFHGVDDSPSVLTVSARQLERLLDWISDGGHSVVPLRELLVDETDGRVALTFDDGLASTLQATEILARRGLVATLFVIAGRVGEPRFLTWAEIRGLQSEGWQIGAHSVTHPDLSKCSNERVQDEIGRGLEILRAQSIEGVDTFAYPYGRLDERVLSYVRRELRFAVTTELRTLGRGEDPHLLPRLDAYYLKGDRRPFAFGSHRHLVWLRVRAALRELRTPSPSRMRSP